MLFSQKDSSLIIYTYIHRKRITAADGFNPDTVIHGKYFDVFLLFKKSFSLLIMMSRNARI